MKTSDTLHPYKQKLNKLKTKLNVKTNLAFMKLTVAVEPTNTFEKSEEISRFVLMNISHTYSLTVKIILRSQRTG